LDRVYTAEDFTAYLSSLICNGILDTYRQCFAPTVKNLSVTFGTGKAWINGHYLISDTLHTVDCASYVDESLDRYVVIALFCDLSTRTCGLRIQPGIAATEPVIPSFTNNNVTTYLTLAAVRLRAGATELTAEDVIDYREDESKCGYCKCILGKCKVTEMLVKMTQLKADMDALKAREDAQDSKIAKLEEKLKAFTSDVVAAGQCGEDVYYIRYADGHVLLQGSGATYDYSDESTPKSVFYNMPEIKSVIVQEGITKLGNALFYRCQNMQTISLPSTLTELGYRIFAQGSGGFQSYGGLTELTLPAGIQKLGGNALRQTNITELVIPARVSVIEDYLLSTCTKLKTVRAESSVLGSFMFVQCTALESLTISTNCKTFGSNMLTYCESLTAITYEGTKEQWNAITKPTNWMTSDAKANYHNSYLQRINCVDGAFAWDSEDLDWKEETA
ncbi:MAG TPA: cell surface protein, partial [Ruminococcus sp.]|nr:cell surface protein [Ruminococcus sp.]